MNKGDLVAKVHERATSDEYGIELTKKSTGELIDIIFNTVGEAVKDNSRFSYPNFGTFTVKERQARDGRNPRTKEKIRIPASKTVNFKPAPALKDSL